MDVVDEPGRRFVWREGDGALAELVYDVDDGRLVLVHTEVPEALQGHGIAGRLVAAAIDRAARTGETVVPRCPYARRWLRDHPAEAAKVTIDWRGGVER